MLFALIGVLSSCDNNVDVKPRVVIEELDTVALSGTGSFRYTDYAPLSSKPVQVYYHIPSNASATTPILMVYHGAGRDAEPSRNLLIDEANAFGFIVLVPEFSTEDYPGGDVFNLGNIFEDGDNPSPTTLNDESIWTFSIVDPLFDYFTAKIKSSESRYDVFGFSAGGQFAHRHVIFKPQGRYNRVVAASSGWYTTLNDSVDFPYGLRQSPEDGTNLTTLLAKPITIMVGDLDNDPDAGGLRHNNIVDEQGFDRLARAKYFYNEAEKKATDMGVPFKWNLQQLSNVNHDYEATSSAAAVLLYK